MRHPRFAVLATLLLVAPLSASSNDKWLLLEAELESLAQAPVSAEGVQNETFEVSGWVRNIENTAYKTFAFDGSTFQATTIYFVGDPRTYGMSVFLRFF